MRFDVFQAGREHVPPGFADVVFVFGVVATHGLDHTVEEDVVEVGFDGAAMPVVPHSDAFEHAVGDVIWEIPGQMDQGQDKPATKGLAAGIGKEARSGLDVSDCYSRSVFRGAGKPVDWPVGGDI